ncbi:MAG TPA: c-type cytochrome [Gaiellales bacterium]|nr:c-type cytochrome [Gaiellales bacterium]
MARIVPAEQQALDRPWRKWASIAVGGFVVVSLIFGFLILPTGQKGAYGLDTFSAICRAFGVPGYGVNARGAPAGAAPPVSQVAWTPDTRHLLANASPERGAKLATEVCGGCHGENGVSVDPTQFPNLAGHPVHAIFKQLSDYRAGDRVNETMQGVAQGLEPQQMADAAAYYAARTAVERLPAETAVDPAIMRLVNAGDPARALPACNGCHGGEHSGPVETPLLLGQPADYLAAQLAAFGKGERHNDLYQRMRSISGLLTPAEAKALAVYYGGMPVPKYR